MAFRDRTIEKVLLLCIFLIPAAGVVFLGLSYIPYDLLKAKVDSLAIDKNATFFTTSFFEALAFRVRSSGFAVLFAGLVLVVFRRHVLKHLSGLLVSFASFRKEIARGISDAFKNEDLFHLITLALIFLFAVWVRLHFLFLVPMRGDESYTFMRFASKPFFVLLTNYVPNNHIFHTVLVHIAYSLFGNQPWIIRIPAFIAGLLMVPAAYIFVRSFYNKYAAILTSALVASSSLLVDYSTNARGYTMLALFFLIAFLLAEYLLRNRNSSAWVVFALIASAGFYTSPIMLYPFGIVMSWLMLSIIFNDTEIDRWYILKNLSISLGLMAIVIFILYSPVFLVLGFKAVVANRIVVPHSWMHFFESFILSLGLIWAQWNVDLPGWLSILLTAGFGVSVIFNRRLVLFRIPFVVALLCWCVPILMLLRVVPFERVWLFMLPLYFGLASAGISYLSGLLISDKKTKTLLVSSMALVLTLWLCINAVRTDSIYYHHSYEGVTLKDADSISVFLKDYLKPGDRVLLPPPTHLNLVYYFKLNDVPIKYLYTDEGERLLLVVNEVVHGKTLHQTLPEIYSFAGLKGSDLGPPLMLKQFDFSTLYEVSVIGSSGRDS